MVPEKMVYGNLAKMKEAGPPHCLVVHGDLPSGPRRITQRSTANSVTERSAAAAPAAADDEGDDIRSEKTKRSPWPPKSVPTEVGNNGRQAGHFLCPLVTVDFVTKVVHSVIS